MGPSGREDSCSLAASAPIGAETLGLSVCLGGSLQIWEKTTVGLLLGPFIASLGRSLGTVGDRSLSKRLL